MIERFLPYLNQIKDLGCHTFIRCIPAYLGRDPLLTKNMKGNSLLNKDCYPTMPDVMTPEKLNGGEYRCYAVLFEMLISMLRRNYFQILKIVSY
jgi:hypothetical protein